MYAKVIVLKTVLKFTVKRTAGSIYDCTAKDVDVTTLSRRTSTVVNGTLLEQ
jgi:hypothetical protein